MSEFDLIRRYFTRATPDAILGVGDDAALLRVNIGMELAVSTDMLVSGTHFLSDADPFMLGHKALAVNLSDMAAMGAQPRWAMLAVSLHEISKPGCSNSVRDFLRWRNSTVYNWLVATPRTGRSICALPSWEKYRRARRYGAAERR